MARVKMIVDQIINEGWSNESVKSVLSMQGDTDFYVQDTPTRPSTIEVVGALCRNIGYYINFKDDAEMIDLIVRQGEGDDVAYSWRWKEESSGRSYRVRVEVTDG